MYQLTDRFAAVAPGEETDLAGIVIIPHFHPSAYPWWSGETVKVLTAMEGFNFEGMDVLDFGCGASAVLSIAAARMGAASVVALEIHPELAEIAQSQVDANGLGDVIKINPADAPWSYDIVLANLGFKTEYEAREVTQRGARYIATLTDGTVLSG